MLLTFINLAHKFVNGNWMVRHKALNIALQRLSVAQGFMHFVTRCISSYSQDLQETCASSDIFHLDG